MSDLFSGWSGWLQQHANWPGFYDFFSDTLGPLSWWVLLQVAILLIGSRRGLRFAWIMCIAVTSNTLFKWLWAQPRPYWVDDSINPLRATPGFGMPSGHAQGATALGLGIWLLLRGRALLALVIAFILFTGLSRVYYGVHSPQQVLIGTAFGIGLSLLAWKLLPGLEARLQDTALIVRASIGIVAIAVVGLVSVIVYKFREDFVAPTEWLVRFEATQQRFAETGPIGLVDGNALVLIALLVGYVLMAVVASERGHRMLIGPGKKLAAIACAVVINLLVLVALRESHASIWVSGLWLCVQPLVAIWLPLLWFGQADEAHGL